MDASRSSEASLTEQASPSGEARIADASRTATIGALAVIAIGAILCYANAFNGVFLFDDQSGIVDNASIRQLWPLGDLLSPPAVTTVSGRPIVNLTFGVNYALGGLDVRGYHAVNLLIHILAAWALFGIVRRTLRFAPLCRMFGRHADALALTVALIWAAHPLQTESVTYIVQRAESLAGLAYLATLYAFIRYQSAPSKLLAATTILCCAIGMFCKETMATAPLVLLAFDVIVVSKPENGTHWKRRIGIHAGLFATIGIVVLLGLSAPRGAAAGFDVASLPTPLEYVATQFGVVLHYLRLTLWPTPLCLDYGWPIETSSTTILVNALVVSALALSVSWAAIRRRPSAFPGIWFFVILAPTSSFLPMSEMAFEHRMYLPLAGPIVLIVLGTYRILARGTSKSGATGTGGSAGILACGLIVAATLGIATFDRNQDYASAETMWSDVVSKRPDNARARFNLAHAMYEQGRIDDAIEGIRKAIALDPDNALGLNELGVLLSLRGEHETAIEHLRRATAIQPENPEFEYNLGIVLSRNGQDAAAAEAYERCIAQGGRNGDAEYNLGNIEFRRGNVAAAEKRYVNALRIRPDHIRANCNLASLLNARGDRTEASDRINRAFASAMRIGNDMQLAKRPLESADAFGMAVQIRPTSAEAHFGLARAQRELGELERALQSAREAARLNPSQRELASFVDSLTQTLQIGQ